MLSCVMQGAAVTAKIRRKEDCRTAQAEGQKLRRFRFTVRTEEHRALEFLSAGTMTALRQLAGWVICELSVKRDCKKIKNLCVINL